MPVHLRRLLPPLLAATLLLSVLGSATAAAAGPSVASAESAALSYANKERTARGLVALRLDPRVQEIAHGRAEVMAETDELSHSQADGNNVFDILSAAEVKWYRAGEIIAWNSSSDLVAAAKAAVGQWMKSSPHRAIMLSKDYNYMAFGLAISPDTGRRYWAGVFIKGPDRTQAWAKLYTPVKRHLSSTKTSVTFSWTGADIRLQVLTAGLSYYEIGRQVEDGDWVSYTSTRATSLRVTWSRGHTYHFRVRTVDKAGNRGGWLVTTVRL